MKIPPQTFFNFCSTHVPLLSELAKSDGEFSEADLRRLIRANPATGDELLETTWRRLRELQIVVAVEPDADFYLMAEPVRKLISYLYDEAQAATPEMVRGSIDSLRVTGNQLRRSIEEDDISLLKLAIEEVHGTLRRIHNDIEETRHRILDEVARYKTERRGISVRDKFIRINSWMNRFVDPMVEIVRPDGPLRETFDETERLMLQAREHGLFNDLPALERGLRRVRFVQRYALRVFQQCRRELQPLYESLRRASLIAQGAALALRAIEREGLQNWGQDHIIPSCVLRWQHVPGDSAIERALRNVFETPTQSAPVISFALDDEAPPDLIRRYWLDGLPAEIRPHLPVGDILDWLVRTYPGRTGADILAGFTFLVFNSKLSATFSGGERRDYQTSDCVLDGKSVVLSIK